MFNIWGSAKNKFKYCMSLDSLVWLIENKIPIELEFRKTRSLSFNSSEISCIETIYSDGLTPIGEKYYSYSWKGEVTKIEEVREVNIRPLFEDEKHIGFKLEFAYDYFKPTHADICKLFKAIASNNYFAQQVIELILYRTRIIEQLELPSNLVNLRFLSMEDMTPFARDSDGIRIGSHPTRAYPPDLSKLPALKIFNMHGTWFTHWPNFKQTKLEHLIQGDCGQELPPDLPPSLIGYYTDNSTGCTGRMNDAYNFDSLLPSLSSKDLPKLRKIYFKAYSSSSDLHPLLGNVINMTMVSRICLANAALNRDNLSLNFNMEAQFSYQHYRHYQERENPGQSYQHLQGITLTKELLDEHFSKVIDVIAKASERDPDKLTKDRVTDLIRIYMDLSVSGKTPESLIWEILKGELPPNRSDILMKNAIALKNMFDAGNNQESVSVLNEYIKQHLPQIIDTEKKKHSDFAPLEYIKLKVCSPVVKAAINNALTRKKKLKIS